MSDLRPIPERLSALAVVGRRLSARDVTLMQLAAKMLAGYVAKSDSDMAEQLRNHHGLIHAQASLSVMRETMRALLEEIPE